MGNCGSRRAQSAIVVPVAGWQSEDRQSPDRQAGIADCRSISDQFPIESDSRSAHDRFSIARSTMVTPNSRFPDLPMRDWQFIAFRLSDWRLHMAGFAIGAGF